MWHGYGCAHGQDVVVVKKYYYLARVSLGKRKVQIVELQHLEKDYLLLDARLRLIRKNTDPALASGKCRILEFTPLFLPFF